MRFFETDRLILRSFTLEDAPTLHREIYSDLEVLQYYNGGKLFTLMEVEAFLPQRIGGNQFGYWAVVRKEDQQLIGQVHLGAYVNGGWYELPDVDPFSPFRELEVELAFAFGRRFQGQGYATEACRPLLRFAFEDLRLRRLVGGADARNTPSIRLQERLGYQIFPSQDGTGVATVLENPLAGYRFRPYREEDREEASALGTHVIDWWHAKGPEASLHLVAEERGTGKIVGHLQAVDQGFPEPSRRPGHCHLSLHVSPGHQRRGVGSTLYRHAEAFARRRNAKLLYAAYFEHENAPAASFLRSRGFEPLERFLPSSLDLTAFDPASFKALLSQVRSQGIELETYGEMEDTEENRRKLHGLEQIARASQPFREVEPFVAEPYEAWEEEFVRRDPSAVFLARHANLWVGVVTGLEWYFTGVHPDWRGRGLATALKVMCLAEAKKRGIERMETENHEDNLAMLAVNRKLGFVFGTPEVALVKRF